MDDVAAVQVKIVDALQACNAVYCHKQHKPYVYKALIIDVTDYVAFSVKLYRQNQSAARATSLFLDVFVSDGNKHMAAKFLAHLRTTLDKSSFQACKSTLKQSPLRFSMACIATHAFDVEVEAVLEHTIEDELAPLVASVTSRFFEQQKEGVLSACRLLSRTVFDESQGLVTRKLLDALVTRLDPAAPEVAVLIRAIAYRSFVRALAHDNAAAWSCFTSRTEDFSEWSCNDLVVADDLTLERMSCQRSVLDVWILAKRKGLLAPERITACVRLCRSATNDSVVFEKCTVFLMQ